MTLEVQQGPVGCSHERGLDTRERADGGRETVLHSAAERRVRSYDRGPAMDADTEGDVMNVVVALTTADGFTEA